MCTQMVLINFNQSLIHASEEWIWLPLSASLHILLGMGSFGGRGEVSQICWQAILTMLLECKSIYRWSNAAGRLLNADWHRMVWLQLKNLVATSLEQSPDEWAPEGFKKAVHINLMDPEREQREGQWQGVGETHRWCQAEGKLGPLFSFKWRSSSHHKRGERQYYTKKIGNSLSCYWNNVGRSLFFTTIAALIGGHQPLRTMHYNSKWSLTEFDVLHEEHPWPPLCTLQKYPTWCLHRNMAPEGSPVSYFSVRKRTSSSWLALQNWCFQHTQDQLWCVVLRVPYLELPTSSFCPKQQKSTFNWVTVPQEEAQSFVPDSPT